MEGTDPSLVHRGLLRVFVGHQLGAFVASAVDFGTMTALTELAGMRPSFATVVGALVGGMINFVLGRRLIFRATQGTAAAQALRYAAVSGASLLLNAAGVWLFAERIQLADYRWVRLAVSFLVSVAWNFPMQRYFVFPRDQTPGLSTR